MDVRRCVCRIIIIGVICFNALHGFSEQARLVPESYVTDADAGDSSISIDDAIRFSLLFSAVSSEDLPVEAEKIYAIIEEFRETIETGATQREIAENALVFLHQNVLTTYSENQTYLQTVFTTGKFNCVSSAVLYAIMMQALGIEVRGVKTTDHAFCRVNVDGVEYDVETTNEYGFDPGSKKGFTDSFGNITGYSYVSAGSYKKRMEIPVRSLISIILHNRISFLDKKEAYDQAVGLAVDSSAFARDDDSRAILEGSIVNMGAWYNKRKKYEDGIAFFDRVLGLFEKNDKYLELLESLTHNFIVRLIDAKKYDDAGAFVSARSEAGAMDAESVHDFSVFIALGRAQDVSKKSFADALVIIRDAIAAFGADKRLTEIKHSLVNNWIASLVNAGKPDESIALIADLRKKGDLDGKDYTKYMVIAVQKKAELVQKEKGELEAAAYLDAMINEIGKMKPLLQLYDYMIEAFEVSVHNSIARLFNDGKYEDAETILREALEKLPSSKKIKADLDKVKQKLAQ